MSVRRLAEHQPKDFAFSAENLAWAKREMEKYPPGRQASAIIPLLVARAGTGRRLAAGAGDPARR